MNKRIDLEPLKIHITIGQETKIIVLKCYKDEMDPGFFFEVSLKHDSGEYTDVIAGGGVNYDGMIIDVMKKVKKYFEYDTPSFRVIHKK